MCVFSIPINIEDWIIKESDLPKELIMSFEDDVVCVNPSELEDNE